MKYCPQCQRQYTESWVTFCSDDGAILVEQFSPPGDPNWDPRIRPTQFDNPSESATQWPNAPSPGGWLAPDERPPIRPAWQQPPPPPYVKQPSQNLAIASMVLGLLSLFAGFCLGPIPGIVAVVLGLIALSQIKSAPDRTGGRPFAITGVITGSVSVLIFGLWILFAILRSIVS